MAQAHGRLLTSDYRETFLRREVQPVSYKAQVVRVRGFVREAYVALPTPVPPVTRPTIGW